jgi:CDGSH iron-sulfur domain-containing protein 3
MAVMANSELDWQHIHSLPSERFVMSEPVIAARAPIAVEVEAGKTYWWCTCGRSAKQPFCDGSHKGTDFAPMKYEAESTGKQWFCACKHTTKAPLCDGSHKALT